MAKVRIELEVEDAQKLASSLRYEVRKIDWVLDNTPSEKIKAPEKMDAKAKYLATMATLIEAALHKRALDEGNVVKMAKK